MPKVGLLFDTVSKNTGDEAMGIAIRQAFKNHTHINVEIVDPFSFNVKDYDSFIVGGGQLLRAKGDPYYDIFRVEGGNILNAIGLLPPVDQLEYLRTYDYVSTRTKKESEQVRKYVKEVHTIPCMTTMISHEGSEYKLDIKDKEKVVGIHIVPYTLELCPGIVEIINTIPYKKVFIPFTHYNQDKNFMESLPFDFTNAVVLENLSPLELHSVISQMSYVIASSLHASIFAYSQNVPFASLGQEKVHDYFSDRGLEKLVFSSDGALKKIIEKLNNNEIEFKQQVDEDKKILTTTIGEYVRILTKRKSTVAQSGTNHPTKIDERSAQHKSLKVRNTIAADVIKGRDRLLGAVTKENLELKENVQLAEKNYLSIHKELSGAIQEIETLKRTKSFRLGFYLLHPDAFFRTSIYRIRDAPAKAEQRFARSREVIDAEKIYSTQITRWRQSKKVKKANLAVIIHLYYTDNWPLFVKKLQTLEGYDFDIFISLPTKNKEFTSTIEEVYPNAYIMEVPNWGRDVLPFIKLAPYLLDSGYKYLLKFHSKKSPHFNGGNTWFMDMVDKLLPDDKILLDTIFNTLHKTTTGVIGPEGHYMTLPVNYKANRRHLLGILSDTVSHKASQKVDEHCWDYGFFGGTMFWARLDAVESILRQDYRVKDFEFEAGQIDGTFAHSIERAFCLVPELKKKKMYEVDSKGIREIPYKTDNIPTWSDLHYLHEDSEKA